MFESIRYLQSMSKRQNMSRHPSSRVRETLWHFDPTESSQNLPKPFFRIYLSPTPFLRQAGSPYTWPKGWHKRIQAVPLGWNGLDPMLWALDLSLIYPLSRFPVSFYLCIHNISQQGLPDAEAAREIQRVIIEMREELPVASDEANFSSLSQVTAVASGSASRKCGYPKSMHISLAERFHGLTSWLSIPSIPRC